jgi:hypothetical protein
MAEATANAPPAASTGQSPPGSSPATMPVPNRGKEAAALARLNIIVNALYGLIPDVGVGSDIGRAVGKAANDLAKHVPPGSTSQGVENAEMTKMMQQRQAQQSQTALAAARNAGGGAPQPAAPPPAGAGGQV